MSENHYATTEAHDLYRHKLDKENTNKMDEVHYYTCKHAEIHVHVQIHMLMAFT